MTLKKAISADIRCGLSNLSADYPAGGFFAILGQESAMIFFIFRCTASVQASNAISSASSAAVDIHVVEKIINLEIVVKSYKLVSQPIIFEYYAYSGGALNVTWSFGDGSSDIVTNEREVNHTYNRWVELV